MPSFLRPELLWALPVALAPLALHLFFLRRARPLPFSDLELLRRAYERALPAGRLRQALLLASRCLLLAALVAAFARPVLKPVGGPKAQEGLDLLILLDTSWSMGAESLGRTSLERAKAAARELLATLRPSDRAAAAAFSGRLEGELSWGTPEAAAETVARAALSREPSELSGSLRSAYAFLAASRGRRRRVLAVLSDNAKSALSGLGARGLPRLPEFDPEVLRVGLENGEDIPNAGVEEAALIETPAGPALSARAVGYGAEGPWTLRLWRGGALAAERTARSGEARAEFPLFGLGREISGWVETRRDALPEDDRYYYAFGVQEPPRVLLLYGGPDYFEAGRGGYFLKKLLAENAGLPYRLEPALRGRLGELPLEEYGAVILDELRELGREDAQALKNYVLKGGGLWVIAGSRLGGETYRFLQEILPARLGEPRELPEAPVRALRETLASWTPRAGAVRWEEFDYRRVWVRRRYALGQVEGRPLVLDASGEPLLLAREFGRGRVLLWASSFDLRSSNLALKPLFPALADAALAYVSGYRGERSRRVLRVGESLERRWEASEDAPASAELLSPSGRRSQVWVRDRALAYEGAREPGLYVLSYRDGAGRPRRETYAVNVSRAGPEGDLRAEGSPPWALLRPDRVKEDFLLHAWGREARLGLLALAALLLVLEALLSLPRRSRRSRRRSRAAGALALLLAAALRAPARAQEGDSFVWTQVRYPGAWDPYPEAHEDVLAFLTSVTSVLPSPGRRVLELKDPAVFSSPFLLLSGRQAPPGLDDLELSRLRDYLTSGGFLWIEDASGSKTSSFDRWVRSTLRAALPDSELKGLPQDHVVFKTFFLVRRAGGRSLVSGALEGIDWGGQTVVLYSRNDLLGAWAKDPLGRYLHDCAPGGEAQRMEARKLTLNILMYALTGSYKTDAVHQPFLLEKMRSGQP